MHHTTVINQTILLDSEVERESRGGGAIANKEEESTAMDTAIRLVWCPPVFGIQNNG